MVLFLPIHTISNLKLLLLPFFTQPQLLQPLLLLSLPLLTRRILQAHRELTPLVATIMFLIKITVAGIVPRPNRALALILIRALLSLLWFDSWLFLQGIVVDVDDDVVVDVVGVAVNNGGTAQLLLFLDQFLVWQQWWLLLIACEGVVGLSGLTVET